VTDLSGQIVLVTGASSGLGAQFARLLAARGAQVALGARRKDRLDALKAEIEADGGKAMSLELDVAEVDCFEAALDQISSVIGPIDLLVNNAGLNFMARATEITTDQYDTIMNVNLKGPFFLSTAVAKRWIEKKRPGRIVNIASLSAYRTLPDISVYAMSKAAMVHMTACLAREWARFDIAVNGIAPGYIRTEINDWFWETPSGKKVVEFFPRRRVGEPEDLDQALLLMCDPAQLFITGQTLTVDDGQGLA